uniref:non-specific serine/threonine protein kinase n=1 Tax=Leptobrachium leishanense TaxID=445787 RepID=A0A8C5WKU3_9ANUR
MICIFLVLEACGEKTWVLAICICSRGVITIEKQALPFVQKLGEGGFSYVDLVEGVHDGRFYALKRILCHDREDRKEAMHEVEMHRLFNHPNILRLEAHCMIEKGSKWEAWLLLPFVKKGTLWNEVEELRDKNRYLSEDKILHILHGICLGLKAIHDSGYAHRYSCEMRGLCRQRFSKLLTSTKLTSLLIT